MTRIRDVPHEDCLNCRCEPDDECAGVVVRDEAKAAFKPLPVDPDEQRMFDEMRGRQGWSALEQVASGLYLEHNMAPEGGSYRNLKAIAYNVVMHADHTVRKALEPFAAFAEALSEDVPDEIALGIFADGALRFGPGSVTVGDLRKARSAIAALATLSALSTTCQHDALICLNGKWHCQKCAASIDVLPGSKR